MRSLLAHRLVVAGRGAHHSQGRDEYRLTDEGRAFLDAMLRKWPLPTPERHASSAPEAPCILEPAATSGVAPSLETWLPAPQPTAASATRGEQPLGSRRWARGELTANHAAAIASCASKRSVEEAFGAAAALIDISSSDDENNAAGANEATSGCRTSRLMPDQVPAAVTAPNITEPVSALSQQEQKQVQPARLVVRLLVDSRERLRDIDPRGLFERTVAALTGLPARASRLQLQLGDFGWAVGPEDHTDAACVALDCVIERKRISDLVARSAKGDHARQLRRLESCGLLHPFLLLEGEPRQASTCTVYDDPTEVSGAEAAPHAIR